MSNSIKIRSPFLELLHADRRTDIYIDEIMGAFMKLSIAMAPKFPFPARNQTSVVQIVVIHLTD
jgi:hypothetical protein